MKNKSKLNIVCPNPECKDFGKTNMRNIRIASTYKVYAGSESRKEYVCDSCGKYFSETYNTPLYYRKKHPDEIKNVLEHIVRGVGIRDTAELVKMSKDTIEDLVLKIGLHILNWYYSLECELPSGNIEYDELWTFVYQKECDDKDKGDMWVWISLHRESRFLICFVVGKHTLDNAKKLIYLTKGMIEHPSKHNSDELPCYENVFKEIYGEQIIPEKTGKRGRPKKPYYKVTNELKYGVVHKTRERGTIVEVSKINIFGEMDKKEISTTLIERQNLNVRQDNSRLVRKTIKFSKDVLFLIASLGLYLFHYNFRKPHFSLREENINYLIDAEKTKWIKKTPAIAAGITETIVDWLIPLKWVSEFNRKTKFY